MELKKTIKIYKCKGGSGSYTYRISLPVMFLKALNLENDNKLNITLVDNKMIIEKLEE